MESFPATSRGTNAIPQMRYFAPNYRQMNAQPFAIVIVPDPRWVPTETVFSETLTPSNDK
jgi:hypothetical protein